MKVLQIEFKHLPLFKDGRFCVDFFAQDRVVGEDKPFQINGSIYSQKELALVGINATGKTTGLRLINLALSVLLGNRGLSSIGLLSAGIIRDGVIMKITFFHEDKYYQLESTLGWNLSPDPTVAGHFYFKEEILRAKHKSLVKTKKELLDFSEAQYIIEQRSKQNQDVKSVLRDDDSILLKVIKGNAGTIINTIEDSNFNMINTVGQTPSEILQVFDDNLAILSALPNAVNHKVEYHIQFKNSKETFNMDSPRFMNFFFSSGTIKGQNLINNSIAVLKTGGYLLVDELENHFNKELVRVIMDLFREERTNPRGACLIFSTHYAEILDFLDRKDNIYILRKEAGLINIAKFSDEYNRNDVKKSELFISNYLKGTAPSYENIEKMRELVCREVCRKN